MPTRLALVCIPVTAAALATLAALPAVQGQQATTKRQQELATRAREILNKNCLECHGQKPDELEGGLNLLDRAALEKKKVVVPGKIEESRLIKRITSDKRPMPPRDSGKGPLAAVEIAILKDWIGAGAPALTEDVVTTKGSPLADIPAATTGPAGPPPGDVANIFLTRCASCHGGNKPEGGFRIDDLNELLTKGLVVKGSPDQSKLLQRTLDGSQRVLDKDELRMPPPGQGRAFLTALEIEIVRAWITSGARSFEQPLQFQPDQVGDEYVLRSILADVRAHAAEEGFTPYRYFSLNHLLPAGITAEGLELHRQALTLVINHVSRKPTLAVPQPIEPTQTVFRVDIRQLGWDLRPFARRGGQEQVRSEFNLFDLVLLDYPYGLIYDSATYRNLVREFLTPAGLARPVAFVRGDWFVNTAARPPLYEDLLQLPFNFFNDAKKEFGGLEARLNLDVKGDIEAGRVQRAGFTVSGVSRNNRIVERHEAESGYLWVSYDYRSNKGSDNIFQDPVHLNPTGGEMIFRLPNGLQGYYVANGKGVRLDFAPTDIVTDHFASDQTVRNGLACMRCHANGMRRFTDDVRSALEQLPGSPAAFDRQAALRLYPRQAEIDRSLAADAESFTQSLKKLFRGKLPETEDTGSRPLSQASARFLDTKLTVRGVATELGLSGPEKIEKAFQNRELAAAGLTSLASGGAVRRDTWEDFYDLVAEHFGRGVPVIPIDGSTRADYQRPDARANFAVEASRRTLKDGDVLILTIKNLTDVPVFIEAVATGTRGRKAVLTPEVTTIEARGTLKKGFKIDAVTGREAITVYGCDQKFDKGELLTVPQADVQRGFNMTDRLFHRQFYQLPDNGGSVRPQFDVSRMVRKTVEIETQ
jgi:serine/threonine-protein kinase